MKKILLSLMCMTSAISGYSQENIEYQKPSASILELVDVERAPIVSIDSKKEQMVFYYRDAFKSLNDLNQPEMRLAGLRINPKTNISSTTNFYTNIKYKKLKDAELRQISNLPVNARITHTSYSPDETKLAFTNTVDEGVELWVVDLNTLQATKLTEAVLNANTGVPYSWFRNSESLLVKTLPENRKELIKAEETLPSGPIVTTSDGQISQNRTYQDLLKNKTDETNFETLMRSEIYKINLDGSKTKWKEEGLHQSQSFSPDGEYVLITTLTPPYSYLVPYYLFSSKTDIYTAEGKLVSEFHKRPLLENLPIGFMATETGKRNISWRADEPATLYWVEALDGGDPANEVPFRDEVFQLSAPFTGTPQFLTKTINRYGGIYWGNREYALLIDRWWNTRNQKTYVFNPSDSSIEPKVITDRNYQDVYSDPGSPHMERNDMDRYVLTLQKDNIYLFGDGYSANGQFPFIDEFNLKTLKKKRLYTSPYTDKIEDLYSFIDIKKGTVLTRMQSKTEYPNYYIQNINNKKDPLSLTSFENPFKSIANIHKEVITYQRDDGVELTGTLYLPADYDKTKKEKLPMIMWAYPTEFKDKSSAGQNTTNPNSFTYLSYGNPIYWVTRGYAILDDAAFPIVGEGDTQPNDSFVDQLVANAKAAIDAVDSLGYIDRNRVAVGGHSYGAFMTANLLTHSDLFAAGIARSGAYNRTLTPFGFQSEERNYWTSPEVYNTMSPFMNAHKMKTPLLLTHGEADNNSGTHTMQSERYFQALKSFGAPVRLVILPKESHGYAAKENVLHLLWEQDQWLEKYVKNRHFDSAQ
ncbi:MAG: prolyl oligopeptidase family serine peptidase [Dysgonamonadaceae bacterium]|nr:prolyl oligopeptidase family serine peptidase [Dysgonamonadaceae bacterium]